jgi:beta-glucanase (GH16 family)
MPTGKRGASSDVTGPAMPKIADLLAGSPRAHRRLRRQTACVLAAAALLVTVLSPTSAGAARHAAADTTHPTCGGAKLVKAGGGTWQCTFDDEFTGTRLNTGSWTAVNTSAAGYHSGPECFSSSSNNVRVSGGVLKLTVLRTAKPFVCKDPYGNYSSQYTAGQVVTHGKFAQLYGRFSIKAKFPGTYTPGLQSSLWLWPADETKYGAKWPSSGEIDVAEEYSQYADRVIPFVHYLYDKATTNPADHVNVVTNNFCMVTDVSAFHTYTLVWSPTQLVVSFDGHTCMTDKWHSSLSGSAPFNQPFGMQLTQTLGINTNAFLADATPLPATTEVDWVRVWK